jgi:hypothetical protein
MIYFIGIFCILHGLVHLLYMGHALNAFELEKGFVWPERSRVLANGFPGQARKRLAGVLCVAAAIGFVGSGAFVLAGHFWQYPAAIFSVSASSLLFIAFWDGTTRKLHTQGGTAILINLLILVYALIQ